MKKHTHLLLLTFTVCNIVISQTNYVPNPDFETGKPNKLPYCVNAQKNIKNYLTWWKNADPAPCNFAISSCSSADWMDYDICSSYNTHPQPRLSDRYVHMVKDEGIITRLSQTLTAGRIYRLTLRLSSIGPDNTLRIFLTKKEENWNQNSNGNQKLEISGIKVEGVPTSTWFVFEKIFTVPATFDEINHLVLWNGDAGATAWHIDDVYLYDYGCCPEYMLYENTSDLPTITHVSDFIRAGFDAGIDGTEGNVYVLPGQDVTFKAGNFIDAVPGNGFFDLTSGTTFTAMIEDCNPSTSPTLHPIIASIIPNVITPNGDGVNDRFCITAQGALSYRMRVYSKWGNLIFDKANEQASVDNNWTNNLFQNYYCLWDGTKDNGNCVNDGTYYYILDLYSCTDSKQYTGYVTVSDHCRMMNPELNQSEDSSMSVIPTQDFSINPNPSNGLFYLRSNHNSIKEIFIYNSIGQVIYKSSVISHPSSVGIDLSSHPKGIYFVKVITRGEEKIYTEKIILQ